MSMHVSGRWNLTVNISMNRRCIEICVACRDRWRGGLSCGLAGMQRQSVLRPCVGFMALRAALDSSTARLSHWHTPRKQPRMLFLSQVSVLHASTDRLRPSPKDYFLSGKSQLCFPYFEDRFVFSHCLFRRLDCLVPSMTKERYPFRI